MITAEIIAELHQLTIRSAEDYTQLDRLDELTDLLPQNPDGQLACEALLGVLERHPQIEFGAPGQLVHTLENYRGQYEKLLLVSLARRPTATTIWMLNRIINATAGAERQRLIDIMHAVGKHPLADEQAKAAVDEFARFQSQRI
jgi:hypothetical protein